MISFVVVDTETTGMCPEKGAELLEIGGVAVEDWEVNESCFFSQLIKPKKHIPIFITGFTGISSRMVQNCPGIEEVIPRFIRFIGDRTLVMHNAPFDLSFLNYSCQCIGLDKLTNPVIDTINLSKALFRGRHNLDIVLARLGILSEGRHRALGDALATAKAFVKMVKLLGQERLGEFITI